MDKLKVSVGLPVFKKKYLGKTISSILSQSFNNFELIIINDDSPENLDELIYSYVDPRIIYIKNEFNLGKTSVVKNWNKCLSYAKGEYFVLGADDDYYEIDFLKEMVEFLDNNKTVNVCHCRLKIINDKDEVCGISNAVPPIQTSLDFLLQRLNNSINYYVGDFMCRTKVLKAKGGFIEFPLAWGSDIATWTELSFSGGIGFVNKFLFNYRINNQSISKSSHFLQKIEGQFQIDFWIEKFIKKQNYTLHPENSILIDEIVRIKPIFLSNGISNELIKGIKNNPIGVFIILNRFYKLKKLFKGIEIKIMLKALKNYIIQLFKFL